MQTVLETIGIVAMCFGFVLVLMYIIAWRKFTKSVTKFTNAVSASTEGSQALQQAMFQLYKELAMHDVITRETADRFKREYKKVIG